MSWPTWSATCSVGAAARSATSPTAACKRRPEFDEAAATLGVPFDLLHRDERSPALAALTDGALPCVVAEGDGEQLVLVDRAALAACGKDPAALVDAIRSAAATAHLVLGTA